MLTPIPRDRVRRLGAADEEATGDYVLYWMIASRRAGWSFALEHAAERASRLRKPLLVLEPLRSGYRWACARFHRFVMDGMADNRKALEAAGAGYHAYVERRAGEGSGLVQALAKRACLVVTDDWPCFFLPQMVEATAEKLTVPLDVVDGCGLRPMRSVPRVFPTARGFRRNQHDALPCLLERFPLPDPVRAAKLPKFGGVPRAVAARWPDGVPELSEVDVPATPGPVEMHGGSRAARKRLASFLERDVDRYGTERNSLDDDPASGLSAYLHFGHLSAHEIVSAILERAQWNPGRLVRGAAGSREGYWGLPAGPESYLDQLVTWREIGFNMCALDPAGYERFESLPNWARATLDKHAPDPRESRYAPQQFEDADTHDPLWNAAQTQLVREGRMHNYLRMLWGKKILEWSASPRQALEIMVEQNNKWALDGRDPNSYSGIFWTLGRYDRPWFPERAIFGVVRFMSSASTARKMKTKGYLARYAPM